MLVETTFVPDGGVVWVTIPATPDYRSTFSGSALPLPSEAAAFDPPSQVAKPFPVTMGGSGRVVDLSGEPQPSWYYRGGTLVPPRAIVDYARTTAGGTREVSEMLTIENTPIVPFRSLTPFPRTVSSARACPVVTMETRLRASAMPGRACPLNNGFIRNT